MYAELPGKRLRQIIGDALFIGWCLLWAWIGRGSYRLVEHLAVPGRYLSDAGDGLGSLGNKAPGLLKDAFNSLNGPSDALHNAGQTQIAAVHDVALVIGVLVAMLAIVPALVPYAWFRVRWLIDAAAVRSMRHNRTFIEVLAKRASARQSLRSLARTMGANGALDDTESLAALELSKLGMRTRG